MMIATGRTHRWNGTRVATVVTHELSGRLVIGQRDIKKGYLKKQNSDTDRREYHLVLSEKYYNYTDIMRSYVKTVLGRIEDSFSHEETELFSNMLMRISAEMMPEAGNFE